MNQESALKPEAAADYKSRAANDAEVAVDKTETITSDLPAIVMPGISSTGLPRPLQHPKPPRRRLPRLSLRFLRPQPGPLVAKASASLSCPTSPL